MSKTSTASKRKYNEKAYDRIALSVPKGKKEEYKQLAESNGMSLNGFINKLLENAIKNK